MSDKTAKSWILPATLVRLPRVVTPREHEPADSVLVRLAIANGYGSIQELLRHLPDLGKKIRCGNVSRNESVGLAARLSGASESAIDAATPYRNNNAVELNGHRVRAVQGAPRLHTCSACLIEDTDAGSGAEALRPFRRNWWEIQSVTSCPKHRVKLLSQCPSCAGPIKRWNSPVSCDCDPHVDFRRTVGEAVGDEDLIHDRWVLGRLGISEPLEHLLLSKMQIDVGSRLCFVIGTLIERDYAFPRRGQSVPSKYSGEVASAGWRVLHDWPISFAHFLDKLLEKSQKTSTNRRSKTAHYGGFYQLLSQINSPELDVINDQISNHIRKKQAVSMRTKVNGNIVGKSDYISLSFATKSTNLNKESLREITSFLGISDQLKNIGGRLAISTKALKAVQLLQEQTIIKSDACDAIGCGEKVMEGLIAAEVIRVRYQRGRYWLDRHDVETLAKLVQQELSCIDERLDDHVAGGDLERHLHPALMSALVSGVLSAVGRRAGAPGFEGMIFDRSSLVAGLAHKTRKIPVQRCYSEKGWSMRTITDLRRMGILSGEVADKYQHTQEFEDFCASHITIKEMLDSTESLSRKVILEILEQSGVQRSVTTSVRTTDFWPRDAALKALAPHVKKTGDLSPSE